MSLSSKVHILAALVTLTLLFQNCSEITTLQLASGNTKSPFYKINTLVESDMHHLAFPQVTNLNGVIYALYNQGENHYGSCNSTMVMMKKSFDQGENWSEPTVALQSADHSVNINSLTNDGNQLIATIMERRYTNECSASELDYRNYKVMKSVDGLDWELADTVNSFPYGTPLLDANNNVMISSYWGGEYTAIGEISFSGNVFNGSGLINTGTNSAINAFPFETNVAPFAYSETAYERINSTTIYAVSRAFKDFYETEGKKEDYYLYEAFSFDNGLSWSSPKYLFRGGPAELLTLKNGSILRCFTYRKVYHTFGGTRLLFEKESSKFEGGVYCQISHDGARSWTPRKLILKNNMHWDIGYAEATELEDGKILILGYENDGFATSEESARVSSSTGERTYRVFQVIFNTKFLLH